MNHSQVFKLKDYVDYQENSIVSTKIKEMEKSGLTLFAFSEGQRLSTHSSPFDAIIQVVEGEGLIQIDGEDYSVKEGEMIIMPAEIPHAVIAEKRFKMLLTMLKA